MKIGGQIQRLLLYANMAVLLIFVLAYKNEQKPLFGDALGYYLYLPGAFIQNNLFNIDSFNNAKAVPKDVVEYCSLLKERKSPLGHAVNQYTIGVAIMELPFFAVGHSIALLQGGDASGFSPIYLQFITLSNCVYLLWGLLIVYGIVKRFFSDWVALASCATLLWGTNLFWFGVFQPGMAHIPLFFLYACFIKATIAIHEKPSWYSFSRLGLILGLITLIRPVDIVCVLIPLCYNISTLKDIPLKWKFLMDNILPVTLAAVLCFVVWIPQLIYWKQLSGSYFFYSYGAGQSFFWNKPKIMEGLMGGNNGWLPYCPVMVLAIVGLIFKNKLKPFNWSIYSLIPIYIYIIYSWYCYNYINGYGSRPMIHLYPLLALPLAAFIEGILKLKIGLKSIVGLLYLFLVAVNMSYSYQQHYGLLLSEASSTTFNEQILFKTTLSYNDLLTHDLYEVQAPPGRLKKIATIATEAFDDSENNHYVANKSSDSHFVYHMTGEEYQPKTIITVYNKKTWGNANYVKCSGKFMYPKGYGYNKPVLVFSINDSATGNTIFWKGATIENKIGLTDNPCHCKTINLNHCHPNRYGTVYYYAQLPKYMPEGAVVKLYVWCPGGVEAYIDDICLETYRTK